MIDALKAAWQLVSSASWFRILAENWMKLIPFSLVFGLFGLVMTYANELHDGMATLTAYLGEGSWGGYYAKVNVLLPMTETLGMLAALGALKIAAMILRFTKSMITNVLVGS